MIIVGILDNKNNFISLDILSKLYLKNKKSISVYNLYNYNNISYDSKSVYKYILSLYKKNYEAVFIIINNKAIEHNVYKDIIFDIILCNNCFTNYKNIKSLCENTRYNIFIYNADDKDLLNCIRNTHSQIVSYGLNRRASITASSIQNNDKDIIVQCCIQRDIITINNEIIEPQEFCTIIRNFDNNCIYTLLSIISTAILLDIKIVEKIHF